MDIDRIAIVLHKAVITKLQYEARLPEELTQEQLQAAYDRVYDILQDTIKGRDLRIHKMDIQKEATLRAIQEIPISIRDASIKTAESTGKTPQEETPTEEDIQNLVELELKKRGMQDQELGAVPSLTPAEYTTTNTQDDYPTQVTNTRIIIPTPPTYPPPAEPSPPVQPITQPIVHSTPLVQSTPTITHTVQQTHTTVVSEPTKGSDSLRWEFNTNNTLRGVSRVRIPHDFVKQYPFLLFQIANDDITITHPLIHVHNDWYEIPYGHKCLMNLSGRFHITITDPDGSVLSTRLPLKEAKSYNVHGFIHPNTGIALPADYTPTATTKPTVTTEPTATTEPTVTTGDDTDDEDGKDNEVTIHERDDNTVGLEDDVILLFGDHSIVVFFLSNLA
jgi:hypothetical protein